MIPITLTLCINFSYLINWQNHIHEIRFLTYMNAHYVCQSNMNLNSHMLHKSILRSEHIGYVFIILSYYFNFKSIVIKKSGNEVIQLMNEQCLFLDFIHVYRSTFSYRLFMFYTHDVSIISNTNSFYFATVIQYGFFSQSE
jgi:hypothetical protein